MTTAVGQVGRDATVFNTIAVSLRPHQWVKNVLVFGGVLFARRLDEPATILQSINAFLLFSFAASSIYLLNDVRDRAADRLHPSKMNRPIASGALSPQVALSVGVLLAGGCVMSAFTVNTTFGVLLSLYIVTNLAYSLGLKQVVILDVMLISAGFVMRAVGGAIAIGEPASAWIVLCTMTLALLVGFGKRRCEIAVLKEGAAQHRTNLQEYTVPFLDLMMAISASAAAVMYALYATAAAHFRADNVPTLVLTTPFVFYGIFRYLYLVHHSQAGGDPSRLFVGDRPLLVNGVLWVIACTAALYGPGHWAIW